MSRPPLIRPVARLMAAAAALLLAASAGAAESRELAADTDSFVEVEIAGIGITTAGVPAVLLRQPDAEEVIPIFIGAGQARAIVLGLREAETPRPMTHDLLNTTLGALEARLERVYVDDVRDNTFYGMLELEVAGHDAPVRVDSRPSDALALALRAGASIHVSPRVLKAARDLEYEGLDEKIVKAAGITVNEASDRLRQALGLPDRDGVVVSEAAGPARQAGLKAGALITGVNGQTPGTPRQFRQLMRRTPAGEKARIDFWQEGEERRIEVPAKLPEEQKAARAPGTPASAPVRTRGFGPG